jgi:hypothetical protein
MCVSLTSETCCSRLAIGRIDLGGERGFEFREPAVAVPLSGAGSSGSGESVTLSR